METSEKMYPKNDFQIIPFKIHTFYIVYVIISVGLSTVYLLVSFRRVEFIFSAASSTWNSIFIIIFIFLFVWFLFRAHYINVSPPLFSMKILLVVVSLTSFYRFKYFTTLFTLHQPKCMTRRFFMQVYRKKI